jgi:hypothetical protein
MLRAMASGWQLVAALRALRLAPWSVIASRLGMDAEPLPDDLAGLRTPWSPAPDEDPGAAGATFMPLHGLVRWEPEPDWDASADLLRTWTRTRLSEVLHAARIAHLRRDGDAARFAGRVVASFTAAFPERKGRPWSCAMEAGFRAVRLVHAGAHLRAALEQGSASVEDLAPIARALEQHEAFLRAHVDWRFHRTGNHYLIALAARVLLAAHLPRTPAREAVARSTARLFWRELARQVGRDGVHFESSTHYHLLVAEAAVHVHAAAPAPPGEARARLEAMASATAALIRPDGSIAAIGDADDSTLLDPCPQDAPTPGARALIVLHALEAACGAQQRMTPMLMHEAGLAVLAHPDAPAVHVTISATGPGRSGTGGHFHDDATAYELWREGPLIVDRGTGAYAADPLLRERLRGVESHAAVQVDGLPQNEAIAGEPFRRRHRALPVVTQWSLTPERQRIGIGHHGYLRHQGRVAIHRVLELRSDGSLRVTDEITGAGTHALVLRLPWAPGILPSEARRDGDGLALDLARGGPAVASLRLLAFAGEQPLPMRIALVESDHSPLMGVVVSAFTTRADVSCDLPARIVHEIAPWPVVIKSGGAGGDTPGFAEPKPGMSPVRDALRSDLITAPRPAGSAGAMPA